MYARGANGMDKAKPSYPLPLQRTTANRWNLADSGNRKWQVDKANAGQACQALLCVKLAAEVSISTV